MAVCEDAKVPILQGYEKKNESLLTLCGKTRTEYVRQTAAWLKQRVPTIRSIDPRDFGGMRVDFAGVEVDWVVSILDQAYLHKGPICNCKFGSTEALCLEGTLEVIKERYGADILTPNAEKMRCIKKMLNLKKNVSGFHSPLTIFFIIIIAIILAIIVTITTYSYRHKIE